MFSPKCPWPVPTSQKILPGVFGLCSNICSFKLLMKSSVKRFPISMTPECNLFHLSIEILVSSVVSRSKFGMASSIISKLFLQLEHSRPFLLSRTRSLKHLGQARNSVISWLCTVQLYSICCCGSRGSTLFWLCIQSY